MDEPALAPPRLRQPTLVIAGEDDPIIDASDAEVRG
jgi:pimeloyl-ACP methyl ester carboxylesterase